MFLLSRWSGSLVAKLGARVPLIAGPSIVGIGFAIFGLFPTNANYWTNLFPAFLVLGLGLSLTVAPLTTVVMNSVDRDRSGSASGINNAIARVAGVLAIAVLGIVMVQAFSARMERELEHAPLPAQARSELSSKMSRLAALEPPAGIEESTKAAIRAAVTVSFIAGFRRMMMICAVLAFTSAAVTLAMVPRRQPSPEPQPV
jgi:hypothetical protein